jgi:hypothetical protein
MRAFVGVSVKSLRHEIRVVAAGVLTNQRAIEENTRALEGHRLDEHGRRLDVNSDRIDALTHRVEGLETVVSTRFADHEVRLSALEPR